MILNRSFYLSICLLVGIQLNAQVLESAFSEFDDVLDEWKIHINQEEYVEAIRQFGRNPYNRWNISFEDREGQIHRGHLQRKWDNDVNQWDFVFDNEHLSLSTIYRNDIFTWTVKHDNKTFTFTAKDRFGYEWEDRFHKSFEWKMFQVDEGLVQEWYIDDTSTDELSYSMRIASALLIIELSCFPQ